METSDDQIYHPWCRRNSINNAHNTRARDGLRIAQPPGGIGKRDDDQTVVGADRPPPAGCRRCSGLDLAISTDPRPGRREHGTRDQRRLPRLLNAAPSKRARRSNDLLAEYFNLILKSRCQETCFWRIYFGGLPRFANVSPRESAEQRSRLARLRASLRSGPGGNRRARSNASAARMSQSILSGERCVSLFIVQLNSRSNLLRVLGLVRTPHRAAGLLDSIGTALFPASNAFMTPENGCRPALDATIGFSIFTPPDEPSGSRCAQLSFSNLKYARRVHTEHSRQIFELRDPSQQIYQGLRWRP